MHDLWKELERACERSTKELKDFNDRLENNKNRSDTSGERNAFSKLTEKEVRDILILVLEHRMTKKEIAEKYNVSFATIKAIRSGRNWKNYTKDIFERYNIIK